MNAYETLVAVAALILVYGLVSGGRFGRHVTGPMVFTGRRARGSWRPASPSGGTGSAEHEIANEAMKLLAEFGLAILLFTDAARIDPSHLRQEERLPARMLLVGLPGAVLLGLAVAWSLFPDESWWSLILIALILAPTDAALAQSAIANPDMPETVSQTLNVESGLNDGLVLPPILIVLGIAAGNGAENGVLSTLAGHLLLGPLAGAVIGYGGGWLIRLAVRKRRMTPLFQRLSALASRDRRLCRGGGPSAAMDSSPPCLLAHGTADASPRCPRAASGGFSQRRRRALSPPHFSFSSGR